ncbi:MAG TPA: TQO small subunit DoxD [Chloroflexota bacterium]|nr:TQO small subunit DoxD [Chloroflexota bacterium]
MAMQVRPRSRRAALPASGDSFPRYAMLPLRLFMAATFFYAGIQKLTDPGYFDPHAPTYIGSQMAAFATSSPIGFLFQWFAIPFATQVGWAVIVVEIGVGVLTFVGLFTRFTAVIGAMLSLTMFLSATWDVQPYFLGSDSIYAVAWITLAIVGDCGVLSLDSLLMRGHHMYEEARRARGDFDRGRRDLLQIGGATIALVWILGMLPRNQASAENSPPPADSTSATPGPADASGLPTGSSNLTANANDGSSPFLASIAPPTAVPTDTAVPEPTVGQPTLAGSDPTPTVDSQPSATALSSLGQVDAGSTTTQVTTAPTATPSDRVPGAAAPAPVRPTATLPPRPTATSPPRPTASPTPITPSGTLIGTLAQVQQNGGALAFQDPQSGDPSVVINLGGNKLVAYSAVCTHAGCTVRYYASAQRLVCPCHGAEFDPSRNGMAVRGPARRPLPMLNVTVAGNGKIYTTS